MTVSFLMLNNKLLKKIYDARPLDLLSRKYYQNEKIDEFFKFYKDNEKHDDRYKPLSEEDYGRFISKRAANRESTLTREIISLAYKTRNEIISLAEGIPHEDTLPYKHISVEFRIGERLVLEGVELGEASQYIPSQGYPPLVEELRKFQQDLHNPPANIKRDVIVGCAAQHGIYQSVDLLLDPGDPLITTQYTYTGFLASVRAFQPEIIGIPEDKDGLLPEQLDKALGERLKKGLKMPKLMYVVPTGNNPTGTVLTEKRRREIYELACKYDFIILEDDTYMFLNYTERKAPSFLSMDTCGRVVRVDSLSKVSTPGLRMGWVTAPQTLLHKIETHMQTEIMHSCSLSQVLMLHLLSNRESLYNHLSKNLERYRARRDALNTALDAAREVASCPLPMGGMYFWLKIYGVDDVYNMVFQKAVQRGLIMIPGHAFRFDGGAPSQYVRLAFSKIKYEDMNKALSLLVDIIKDEQRETQQKKLSRSASDY